MQFTYVDIEKKGEFGLALRHSKFKYDWRGENRIVFHNHLNKNKDEFKDEVKNWLTERFVTYGIRPRSLMLVSAVEENA